jgi:transcriptional regulator with XRE-family HTH domain
MGRYIKATRGREAVIDKIIGRRLRDARMLVGIQQGEAAERIGIRGNTLCRYESGHMRISASRLVSMSKVLGRSPAWFLEDA